ncbi:hypothetical protein PAPYR_13429 [Paratrimastix pyriformis]|uniref:Uncharacterized protein n=1 Tax=Paratrimastix pyriformis TaxID=342808 RepID=A0ABQ8U095_9EUKA|nr:hypothetical protein PAPYR_13429 [Paratrimastix pyriformis]
MPLQGTSSPDTHITSMPPTFTPSLLKPNPWHPSALPRPCCAIPAPSPSRLCPVSPLHPAPSLRFFLFHNLLLCTSTFRYPHRQQPIPVVCSPNPATTLAHLIHWLIHLQPLLFRCLLPDRDHRPIAAPESFSLFRPPPARSYPQQYSFSSPPIQPTSSLYQPSLSKRSIPSISHSYPSRHIIHQLHHLIPYPAHLQPATPIVPSHHLKMPRSITVPIPTVPRRTKMFTARWPVSTSQKRA